MKINGVEIVTPADDPIGFHLDWRYRLASAMERMLPEMGKDPDLRACYHHLHHRPNPVLERITGWRGAVTGTMLEAYLVTNSPCEAIAVELGLDASDVRLYAQIFWAVRDQQDLPLRGVLARLRSALPRETGEDGRLLRSALLGGLEGLRRQLGGGEVGDLSCLVEQELVRRCVGGQLKNSDLIRMRAHDLTLRKLELESRGGREEDRQAMQVLFDVLKSCAPRMKKLNTTPEQMAAQDLQLRARINSQLLANNLSVTGASSGDGGEAKLKAIEARLKG